MARVFRSSANLLCLILLQNYYGKSLQQESSNIVDFFEEESEIEIRYIFGKCEPPSSTKVVSSLQFHQFTHSDNKNPVATVLQLGKTHSMHRPALRRLTIAKILTLNVFDLTKCQATQISNSVHTLLKTSRYFHKANDHHIFILDNDQLNSLPIFDPPLIHVEKKVAIHIENDHIKFQTLCYFCNELDMRQTSSSMLTYSDKLTINKLLSRLFPVTKSTFHGRTFRVSCSTNVRVRISLRPKGDGTWILNPGVFEKLATHLIQKFNFTASLRHATGGGSTGKQLPNGTWQGSVGDVYNEDADIGLLGANSFERAQLVLSTKPFEYQSVVLVTGKHYQVLTWKLLSAPLGKNVWIALAACIVVAVLFIFLMQFFFKNFILKFFTYREKSKVRLWRNGKLVENILAAFFEQEIPDLSPRPLRIFLVLWVFMAMIISTVYESKLYSSLAFPPIEPGK